MTTKRRWALTNGLWQRSFMIASVSSYFPYAGSNVSQLSIFLHPFFPFSSRKKHQAATSKHTTARPVCTFRSGPGPNLPWLDITRWQGLWFWCMPAPPCAHNVYCAGTTGVCRKGSKSAKSGPKHWRNKIRLQCWGRQKKMLMSKPILTKWPFAVSSCFLRLPERCGMCSMYIVLVIDVSS